MTIKIDDQEVYKAIVPQFSGVNIRVNIGVVKKATPCNANFPISCQITDFEIDSEAIFYFFKNSLIVFDTVTTSSSFNS